MLSVFCLSCHGQNIQLNDKNKKEVMLIDTLSILSLRNKQYGGIDYEAQLLKAAAFKARSQYLENLRIAEENFRAAYLERCYSAAPNEIFEMISERHEYHYTLYQYDVAGNLIQTVPPAGVQVLSGTQLDQVKTNRAIYTHYAQKYNLPVSFTLADGQKMTNGQKSVSLEGKDGVTRIYDLSASNFEGIVRGWASATSIQNDMSPLPIGATPKVGDVSNAGQHVNLVRSNEALTLEDAILNDPNNGYVPTVSGDLTVTVGNNGKSFDGIPISLNRVKFWSPDQAENMNWMMWNVLMLPTPVPSGVNLGVQQIQQDNTTVVQPVQPVVQAP